MLSSETIDDGIHDKGARPHLCINEWKHSTPTRRQFSILYPRNRDLIFSIYQKFKFFLCSKNSYSALYNSIIFIFRYVCKSIIFFFGTFANAIYETDWFVYHLKVAKKKLCHDN